MKDSFQLDSNIGKIAEDFALDAIDFASSELDINLNWSDESIKHVEHILSIFHDQLHETKLSDSKLTMFAQMFGSYLGEVYRRNHTAEWGMVTSKGDSIPGMQTSNKQCFLPWGRAIDRIVKGPENNIWDYYQDILSDKQV